MCKRMRTHMQCALHLGEVSDDDDDEGDDDDDANRVGAGAAA